MNHQFLSNTARITLSVLAISLLPVLTVSAVPVGFSQDTTFSGGDGDPLTITWSEGFEFEFTENRTLIADGLNVILHNTYFGPQSSTITFTASGTITASTNGKTLSIRKVRASSVNVSTSTDKDFMMLFTFDDGEFFVGDKVTFSSGSWTTDDPFTPPAPDLPGPYLIDIVDFNFVSIAGSLTPIGGPPGEIPTLTEWGIFLLILCLARIFHEG